jgi:FKBP-type peptidyl-prolyl cis-trans isomerase (trigger factor)
LKTNNEFELPESLVDRQLQIRVQRLIRDLSRQGINPQRLDVDWAKIREDQRRQAIRDVKGSLILDHISEKKYSDHGRRDRCGNRKDCGRDESASGKSEGGLFP